MKLLYIGSGAALAIFSLSSCATSLDGPPTATGGAAGTGAGGAGTGAGGNAQGAGGNAQGAGGNAQGAGGNAAGVGGNAQGAGGNAAGVGGNAQGAGGDASSAGGGAATACEGGGINNGLVDNGDFCGYGWTASNGEGEVIDPPCGSAGPCFEDGGTSLCATGSIPANTPADSTADPPIAGVYTGVMIGINVADEGDTWTSTGTGITVTFDTGGASTGEVRVLAKAGGTDYCAPATSGVALDWGDFTEACWEAGGEALAAGAAIESFMVQINGADTAQTFTDFCVTDIVVN